MPGKTWVVLLRGVNVGGRTSVRMAELRRHLAEAGYGDVRTYIQSGNIVCRHATRPGDDVAAIIDAAFGFRPRVFSLDASGFRKAAAANPYPPDSGKAVHLFFLSGMPKHFDRELLDSLKSPTEDYTLKGKVLYLHAPDGIGRSKMVDKIDKALPGVDITARNLNTVNKLLEMLDEG